MHNDQKRKAATVNACKLCTPLGAALAFHGIEDAVCLLHGSQGCSTYIRRYLISHFKEPLDIASTNFSEESAVYGGRRNLQLAVANLSQQYAPRLIGVATTCLSETIGDDIKLFIREIQSASSDDALPRLIPVSTASYCGTHADGFHAAVRALAEQMSCSGSPLTQLNIFPGILSPADIRFLKEIVAAFEYRAVITPDYSETLDGGLWNEYKPIPPGGTAIAELETLGRSTASIEFGAAIAERDSAAAYLAAEYAVPKYRIPIPIGIHATDVFLQILEDLSGNETPGYIQSERARLADAYVDGHKYVFGKRVIVYGEEDLVLSLCLFLREIGAVPVIAASGGTSGRLEQTLAVHFSAAEMKQLTVLEEADFRDIEEYGSVIGADIVIGHSKGYKLAQALDLPHVRIGFPIHDRFGGQRILHIGYRGSQNLYDLIVNALLERAQSENPVGYTYL